MGMARIVLATAALALAWMTCGAAAAGQVVPVSEPGTYALQSVVVTAQKRDEHMQDVPISMQAFSGTELEAKGISSTTQLSQIVPGLQGAAIAGFPIIFIRGLGTDNFIPSADPSIALYVDGIYTPYGLDTVSSLAGLRSVEVLKGPQGTLFGRNADGGAISLVTSDPTTVFRSSFEGELTNLRGRSAKVAAAGPVTDWLSAGFSGVYTREDSPYSDPNFRVQPNELKAARVKLRFQPLDSLSLTLTGYRSVQSGVHSLIANNVAPSPLGRLLGITAQPDEYHSLTDYPASSQATQDLAYTIAKWELPWLDVHLLGSYQHLRTEHSSIDFDGSPQPLTALSTSNIFSYLQTGELQLLSNEGSWDAEHLTWVGGVYYLQGRGGIDPGQLRLLPGAVSGLLNQPGLPLLGQVGADLQRLLDALGAANSPLGDGGLTFQFSGVLGTRSLSAYTQATYRFTDWLDLTLGGRAQREDRFMTKSESEFLGLIGSGTLLPPEHFPLQEASARSFEPRAVLGVHPSATSLLYASYAVGQKSGTYNIINLLTPSGYVQPERVIAYELGAKTEFLDRRVRMNLALFDSHIHDLQSGFVSLLSAGAISFVTVPRARSRGGEFEGKWLPLSERNPLVLSLSAAYVDAVYTAFPNGQGFQKNTGLYSGSLNLTGNELDYAPRWSGSLGAAQGLRAGPGVFEVAADEYFNSGYYTDAQNSVREGAFAVLNARAGYLYEPWKLRATLFGQNLLGRRYHTLNQATDFGVVRTLADPRTYGMRISWDL